MKVRSILYFTVFLMLLFISPPAKAIPINPDVWNKRFEAECRRLREAGPSGCFATFHDCADRCIDRYQDHDQYQQLISCIQSCDWRMNFCLQCNDLEI